MNFMTILKIRSPNNGLAFVSDNKSIITHALKTFFAENFFEVQKK